MCYDNKGKHRWGLCDEENSDCSRMSIRLWLIPFVQTEKKAFIRKTWHDNNCFKICYKRRKFQTFHIKGYLRAWNLENFSMKLFCKIRLLSRNNLTIKLMRLWQPGVVFTNENRLIERFTRTSYRARLKLDMKVSEERIQILLGEYWWQCLEVE